jgi:hypothetical protein
MSTRNVLLYLCLIPGLVFGLRSAEAQTTTSGTPVTITSIGCGMAGAPGTPGAACWVYVSTPIGPPGCNSTSIRWDPTQSPNGPVATAQLTAAFLAGKQVFFVLYDTCWAQWPAFPTIYYYGISP